MYYTEKQLAEKLEVKHWRIRYLRDTKKLPFTRIGNVVVYDEISLKLAKILLEEKKPGV